MSEGRSQASRGMPASGRLPQVTRTPSGSGGVTLDAAINTNGNTSSSGANNVNGPGSTTNSSTADLSKVLFPMPRSIEALCRHFDAITVEVLYKALHPEKFAGVSNSNNSRFDALPKVSSTSLNTSNGPSSGNAGSPSPPAAAEPYPVSSALRAALLSMGFIGVKRLLDAMWTSIFGTYRCEMEHDFPGSSFAAYHLSESPYGAGPVISMVPATAVASGGSGGLPRLEVQKISSRGVTTILMAEEPGSSRSPVTTPSGATPNPGFGFGTPPNPIGQVAPACTSECKDHMSPQRVLELQKEHEKNLRSVCKAMGRQFNNKLLQMLQQQLFPPTEDAVGSPKAAQSANPGAPAARSGMPMVSPSPPSHRPTGDSFQRRNMYNNNNNNMGGSMIESGQHSQSPSGPAELLSSLPQLLAIAMVMDRRDDKGASLRLLPKEGIRNSVCVIMGHYHLSEIDAIVLYSIFLDTIVEVRNRTVMLPTHSAQALSTPGISDFNESNTSTSNAGLSPTTTETNLKPIQPLPHQTGSCSPLVYQWFDKNLRSTYSSVVEILKRCRVNLGGPSNGPSNGGHLSTSASNLAINHSVNSPDNTVAEPVHGVISSVETQRRGSLQTVPVAPVRSGSAGSRNGGNGNNALSGMKPSMSNNWEILFSSRAHQFFKDLCPLKYADPRCMHSTNRTPSFFQETLSKGSTFVLHSTDLVFLQPVKSGNPNDPVRSEWAYSSKMWSIRTRLVTLRGHLLYVYSAIASTAVLTEYSGEQSHGNGAGSSRMRSPTSESLTYDSPIAVIDLSRSAGSSVYLVSGPHDIESVTLRTAGKASGWREQPLWSRNTQNASSGGSNLANTANGGNNGLPHALSGSAVDETEILRTYDVRREVQLLSFPVPPGSATSTPSGGNVTATTSSTASGDTSGGTAAPASPASAAATMRWLVKHHYKNISGGAIRQRMYPIRLLCGNELHHFLFQSPGTRAKWYQLFEELTIMLHNQRKVKKITQSFCNMAAFLRNRIPYPVGPAAFKPICMLGAGTYGHVLLVRHRLTCKQFAMKVVRKKNFVSLRSIIEARREHAILESLDCPYIMKLHDTYQTDTCVYFLLDFLSGGDLLKHIQSAPDHHLTENTSRFIIAEVAIALEHLRVRGIVHRDLKGDNLVMNSEGHVVVTDFGFAKRITVDNNAGGLEPLGRTGSTGAGSSMSAMPPHSKSPLRYHMQPDEPGIVIPQHNRCGTVAYIAPEVLRSSHQGEGYGLEVDWWSLGVVFFTLLTGLFPFFKDTTRETTNEILNSAVRFPHEMRGGKNLNLSKEAQHLVLHLLEKKPERRICRLKEFKQHPFFKGFDWDACEAGRLLPPQELHVDMYPTPSVSKDAVERLKRRVEWATQLQLNPPEEPPLHLPLEDPPPYATSSNLAKDFDKHTKELSVVASVYGMNAPEAHTVENDIFNPLFARQERCGSDREILSMHHDALLFKTTTDGQEIMEEDLAEEYIPHGATTASSLGMVHGFPTGEGVTNMSGSFSIMGAYRSLHSMHSPTSTYAMGFSGTSLPIDVAFGFSEEDGEKSNIDPILEDFDEAAYQNHGIRETFFMRDGDTSMYRPTYNAQ